MAVFSEHVPVTVKKDTAFQTLMMHYAVADPDPQIKEGGSHSDPEISGGGAVSKKYFLGPGGLSLG